MYFLSLTSFKRAREDSCAKIEAGYLSVTHWPHATRCRVDGERGVIMSKTYSLAEVAKHRSRDDAWVVVDGRVLDVTRFLPDHPGGEDILLDVSGRDASREFAEVGHSADARTRMLDLVVGSVRPVDDDPCGPDDKRHPAGIVGRTRADAGREWAFNVVAATGLSRKRASVVAGAAIVAAIALMVHRYLISPQLRKH